jgi:uncharacterized protein YkwD
MRSLALLLVVLAAFAPSASSASTHRSDLRQAQTLESRLVHEINSVRTQRHLRPLAESRALQLAADSHSAAMLDQGFFAHESPDGTSFADRLRQFYPASPTDYWSVGENLAMTGPNEPLARDVVARWMQSPRHRANLLDPRWRELGIGVRFAPSPQGAFGGLATWVVTLDLGSRRR